MLTNLCGTRNSCGTWGRCCAARREDARGTRYLRTAVLALALVLIVLGILNGGLEDVLAKGAAICTECIGLG